MIHGVPNRSVSIPQVLGHTVGWRGVVTVPPSARASSPGRRPTSQFLFLSFDLRGQVFTKIL